MTIDAKARQLFQLFLKLPLAAHLMIHPLAPVIIPSLAAQAAHEYSAVSEQVSGQSACSAPEEITDIVIESIESSFAREIAQANQALWTASLVEDTPHQENEYAINLIVLVDMEARNFLGEAWQTKIQQAIDYSNAEFAALKVDDKMPLITFKARQYRRFSSGTNDSLVMLQQLGYMFKVPRQSLVMYFTGRDITGIADGNETNRVVGYAYAPGKYCVIEALYPDIGAIAVHEEGHSLGAQHVDMPGSHMDHNIDSRLSDGTRRFDEQSLHAIYKTIESIKQSEPKPYILDCFRYIPTMIGYVWNNYIAQMLSCNENNPPSDSPQSWQAYTIVIYPLDKIWIDAAKKDNPKDEKYRRQIPRWPYMRDAPKPTNQHPPRYPNCYLARSRI